MIIFLTKSPRRRPFLYFLLFSTIEETKRIKGKGLLRGDDNTAFFYFSKLIASYLWEEQKELCKPKELHKPKKLFEAKEL